VDGLVINHQEQPLEGWDITAGYVGGNGTAAPMTATSDKDGKFHFDLETPGLWQFAIDIPGDWRALTDASFVVEVGYGLAHCLDIRFKVEQRVEVVVLKIDDEHVPLAGWTIIATPGNDNPFNRVLREVTDENGRATFSLPPGHWIFTEQPPDDVTWWSPVIPVQGIQEFDVVAPGPYIIRFKNDVKEKPVGCIQVLKTDVPPTDAQGQGAEPFGLPDWPVQVLKANGDVAAAGTTDAFGEITFNDLPFGPYVVKEIMLPDWEAVTPTTYAVVLTRDDDDCQLVHFQNKQKEKGFCIEGEKLDAFESYGIAGWEIDATPQEAGGIDPDPVMTDGQGKYRIDLPFDDYRVPGSTYEVCEEKRTGWTAVTPDCQTVTVPKYPGACVEVHPFVNRQTNEQFPRPQTDFPQKHNDGKHNDGPHNEGQQHGGKHQGNWQPQPHGGCSAYHTVQPGESLYSIAKQYGKAGPAVMQANSWARGPRSQWIIHTGQQVCIP
jgi:hypothetical protein